MNSDEAYHLINKTGVSSLALEDIINKNHFNSWRYAMNVLKGRFESGEEIVSKHGVYSYNYATSVLKNRFKLGEEMIIFTLKPFCVNNYIYQILKYDHE